MPIQHVVDVNPAKLSSVAFWQMIPALCLVLVLLLSSEHRTALVLYRWEEEEVNRRLDKAMTDAFAGVWDVHTSKRIPLRVAAFYIALQRVTRAHMNRGFD